MTGDASKQCAINMLDSTTRKHFKDALASGKLKELAEQIEGLEDQDHVHTATIEIPFKEAHRYITAMETNGHWRVVDDFKGPIAYGGTTLEPGILHLFAGRYAPETLNKQVFKFPKGATVRDLFVQASRLQSGGSWEINKPRGAP